MLNIKYKNEKDNDKSLSYTRVRVSVLVFLDVRAKTFTEPILANEAGDHMNQRSALVIRYLVKNIR